MKSVVLKGAIDQLELVRHGPQFARIQTIDISMLDIEDASVDHRIKLFHVKCMSATPGSAFTRSYQLVQMESTEALFATLFRPEKYTVL